MRLLGYKKQLNTNNNNNILIIDCMKKKDELEEISVRASGEA
jgi:hypothetical protein